MPCRASLHHSYGDKPRRGAPGLVLLISSVILPVVRLIRTYFTRFTSFSEMLNAETIAAALSAGEASVSQTRFVVKICGPLTQSGYVMDAEIGDTSSPRTGTAMIETTLILDERSTKKWERIIGTISFSPDPFVVSTCFYTSKILSI